MNNKSRSWELAVLCILATGVCGRAAAAERAPNLVIIYCDNLGYGDVGCFGSKKHRTPHVDRMAREGLRMTSFYSTSGVCTKSRASVRRRGVGSPPAN